MFMLGFAFQHGGLPLSSEAVEKAIELNGQAVAMNIAAFRWGRRAAHEPEFVRALAAGQGAPAAQPIAQSLDEVVARRVAFLSAYQSRRYAGSYQRRVAAIRQAEEKAAPGSTLVTEAVARNLFKLMAVKDEYEVARLYTDGSFKRQLDGQFQAYERLEFHLAPPILGRKGADGKARKSTFGPWMMKAFKVLASLRWLRGTPLDLFGYAQERRMERQLLADYQADLEQIERWLEPGKIEAAAALATIPSLIRGYGHVKQANALKAAPERARLLQRLEQPVETAELRAAE
jgi:indolepyruvate ferredoxin oxidoreductase